VPSGELADRLTVVLLTYECGHRLDRVLEHLGALGLPVIAVDNASTDDTAAVLSRHPWIRVVRSPANLGAAGRNLGAEQARTPYVLFCDDDGWYERDGLEVAVRMFDEHPRLAVVNARILVGEQDELDGISVEMAASPVPDRAGIPGPVLLSFMAGAAMVRVSAYREVGGYDPEFFLGGEEETLAFKLLRNGWHMRYLPEAVMHHHPSIANAPRLRAHGMRNTLWNAWLHRRFRSAVRYSAFILADTPKNRDWLRGVGMTLAGLPRVLVHRRPLPRDVDGDLRMLEERRFAGRRSIFNRVDPVLSLAPTRPAPAPVAEAAVSEAAVSEPAVSRPAVARDRPRSA
jgi:GT2 family glycosyltransferase